MGNNYLTWGNFGGGGVRVLRTVTNLGKVKVWGAGKWDVGIFIILVVGRVGLLGEWWAETSGGLGVGFG